MSRHNKHLIINRPSFKINILGNTNQNALRFNKSKKKFIQLYILSNLLEFSKNLHFSFTFSTYFDLYQGLGNKTNLVFQVSSFNTCNHARLSHGFMLKKSNTNILAAFQQQKVVKRKSRLLFKKKKKQL